MLQKFGGRAYAAGVTIQERDFEQFKLAFEAVAQTLLSPADLELAMLMEKQIWGQGFPQPSFSDDFIVEEQRVVGTKHLKLKLNKAGRSLDAIFFFHDQPLPERIHAVYRLGVNEYNGARRLQLIVEHWE